MPSQFYHCICVLAPTSLSYGHSWKLYFRCVITLNIRRKGPIFVCARRVRTCPNQRLVHLRMFDLDMLLHASIFPHFTMNETFTRHRTERAENLPITGHWICTVHALFSFLSCREYKARHVAKMVMIVSKVSDYHLALGYDEPAVDDVVRPMRF